MQHDPRFVYDPRYIVEPGFWELTPEQFNEIANGCGAKAAKLDFVPDCILHADIWLACCAHDYSYWLGKDKRKADREFLHNILVACDTENTFIYLSRYKVACMYFEAVTGFGNASFGKGAA